MVGIGDQTQSCKINSRMILRRKARRRSSCIVLSSYIFFTSMSLKYPFSIISLIGFHSRLCTRRTESVTCQCGAIILLLLFSRNFEPRTFFDFRRYTLNPVLQVPLSPLNHVLHAINGSHRSEQIRTEQLEVCVPTHHKFTQQWKKQCL